MALREVKHYKKDSGLLRKKSRPVEKYDKRLETILDDMAETMYHSEGVGLAAPQIGILRRIVVIDIGEGLTELVNPEIVFQKGEEEDYEGCLSIPGRRGLVIRPSEITVKAYDRSGKEIEVKGTGLMARALSHEIDHLDGILYIDKVIPGTLTDV